MGSKKTRGVQEARKELPVLLEAAHRGSRTVITKRGKPYAAIVPVGEGTPTRAGLSMLGLRGAGKNIWDHDATKIVQALRKEWR